MDALVEMIGATWGTIDFIRALNPEMSADESYLNDAATLYRFAASPREAKAQFEYMLKNIDVRQALPLIQVPTRILHARGNPLVPSAHGHYLADHIDGASFVELPGTSLTAIPHADALIEETAEFVTGERPPVEVDRVLSTVLFTDIVRSTEQLVSVGDHRWRLLLDEHDRTVRQQLRRFRGREVNTTGDGFVACFDGPARAVRCAIAIRQTTASLGLELRLGLHTGECEIRGRDLGGLAVHIAARVAASADPGQIKVTRTLKDLIIGSGVEFGPPRKQTLKGVPGTWNLYAVESV